jgi:hypothetical protein
MELRHMIVLLQALAAEHGDSVEVTLWEYGGGLDDLMNAKPVYDEETQTVVIDSDGRHTSGARR